MNITVWYITCQASLNNDNIVQFVGGMLWPARSTYSSASVGSSSPYNISFW